MDELRRDLRAAAHYLVDQMSDAELTAFLEVFDADSFSEEETRAILESAASNDWVPWREAFPDSTDDDSSNGEQI